MAAAGKPKISSACLFHIGLAATRAQYLVVHCCAANAIRAHRRSDRIVFAALASPQLADIVAKVF
jgi:hypothetical protein